MRTDDRVESETAWSRQPLENLSVNSLWTISRRFRSGNTASMKKASMARMRPWVRPLEGAAIPAEAWSLQVAAEFTLRDGTKFAGFVDLTTAPMDDLVPVLGEDALQPGAVLIVKGQHVCVPTKAAYDYTESRDKLANVLARDLDLIFPLEYQLSVPVVGEQQPRRGNLL
jgi:hypothetical protein